MTSQLFTANTGVWSLHFMKKASLTPAFKAGALLCSTVQVNNS